MKNATSEQMKVAREKLGEAIETRNAARAAAETIANRLTDPGWNEIVDGAALELAQRNLKNAERLVEAKTLAIASLAADAELEQRMAFWGGATSDDNAAPGVSVNVISKRTKDGDLPKLFSLHRAIRIQHGIADIQGNLEKRDGIEREMMDEGLNEARNAEITDFNPNGFLVPSMCSYASRTANPEMERRMLIAEMERRDMVVGTTTAGGHLVQTNLGDLIPFLDPDTPLSRLGARRLTGLVGNLDLPRWAARSTGYAVAEQGSITESTPTLSKLSLAPKRQGAYVESSLQLIRQSDPSVENLTRDDLRTVLMQLQEQYAIQGTGSSNQPTGITATSGIGAVAGGTNGLIPTWAHVTALEYEVAVDNALRGMPGYLITPGVANVFKNAKRDVAGNGFILEGPNNGGGLVNGYPVATSTLVPSTLTKGSASGICHAIIFGNFQELIMAYWGGVEIIVDPYSLATTGSVRITANAFFDVGVRHAQSFSAMLDALIA